MTRPSLTDRLAKNATGIAATAVTGTWLAAMLLGFSWWLAFMLFGYIVAVPVVAMLFDENEETEWVEDIKRERFEEVTRESTGDTDVEENREHAQDALDRLRTRYAEGDLTDEQFERKLGRLLETETPEDAAEYVRREQSRDQSEQSSDQSSEGAREVERER